MRKSKLDTVWFGGEKLIAPTANSCRIGALADSAEASTGKWTSRIRTIDERVGIKSIFNIGGLNIPSRSESHIVIKESVAQINLAEKSIRVYCRIDWSSECPTGDPARKCSGPSGRLVHNQTK